MIRSLVVILALIGSYTWAQPKYSGNCESALVIESINATITEGDVHIGTVATLEKSLMEASVPLDHISNVREIFAALREKILVIPPLVDSLQILMRKGGRSFLICIAQANCKYSAESEGMALFVRFNDHKLFSFASFFELPEWNTLEGLVFEMESIDRAREFEEDKSPLPIVLKPFRPLPNNIADILAKTVTVETAFFHELTHATDVELVEKWVTANIRLRAKGQKTDDIFSKFVRMSPVTGRSYVSDEFYTLFSEARAYYVTLMVRQMFAPRLPNTREALNQMMFGAWTVALKKSMVSLEKDPNFDVMKLAGLPGEHDFVELTHSHEKATKLAEKMLELTIGPKSFAEIMKQTIHLNDRM